VAKFCGHGDPSSGSVEGGNFLHYPSRRTLCSRVSYISEANFFNHRNKRSRKKSLLHWKLTL